MPDAPASAAERLERLPLSPYHRLIFVIIALAFFFDSMDLAMMTFLLGSIKAEFGLDSAQAGLLASSSFFGMVIGAALSGMLADRFGRKPVFQASIVLWGLASYLCSTAGDLGSLGSTRRQILELRLRMAQRREKFQEEVRASLADAQVRAEELRNRLASARFDLANSEVRAPVAGLVVGQEVFTEGGVIAPGQQLMEILPERQPLLVDARLPVEMVDKVRVGLPVELMFSAFNQSTTPRVEGQVTLVSADRLLDERSEAPYYRVRIRVGEEGVRRLAGLEIRPGMPVEAFVRSGERSLLNYLFKPLADRTHLALGEE